MTAELTYLSLNQIQLPSKVAVLGKGMLKNNQLLSATLQTQVVRHYPMGLLGTDDSSDTQAYIGWGNKKSYQRAKRSANRQNCPIFSIEDGFIRSIESGVNSTHAVSLVIDDLGIYFDLSQPSRLEQMICQRSQADNWTQAHQQQAQKLIAKIMDNQISKYNNQSFCPNLDDILAHSLKPLKSLKQKDANCNTQSHVLLIDQVAGDNSIAGACGNERTGQKQFVNMLKTALQKHPNSIIWIKSHPAGKKGYLTEISLPKKYKSRIHILQESVNPIALLKQVHHVYTVSSHMGFEALMLKVMGYDVSVHCFGVSWYSCWGVTDDSGLTGSGFNGFYRKNNLKKLFAQVKKRRQQLACNSSLQSVETVHASVEQLFFSAYLDYCHYVDPASKLSCDVETAIDWLITNREWHNRLKGDLTVYEFSRWKLPFVKTFVDFTKTNLFFKPKPRLKNLLHPAHVRVNLQNPLLVWGLAKRQQMHEKLVKSIFNADSMTKTDAQFTTDNNIEEPTIYCMEDGFIRSNGLGATLLAPLSVVIDTQGIYYNATEPSHLETLLQNCPPLTNSQLQRVNKLQQKLLAQKVSKYNVGKSLNSKIRESKSEKWVKDVTDIQVPKILIVGQVEDDLSVQYCGSLIKTNAELIKRVVQASQENNPDTYLIYKPHPDVEAGLRSGKVDKQTLQFVNAVARDLAMPDCLALVDEVHTISSLTGFEALLRGKAVTCYGLPFYAGWGLTTDFDSHIEPKLSYLKRRKRYQHEQNQALSLPQLIHCTLIDYPIYRLPNGHGLAQVEQVIDCLYPDNQNDESHDYNQTASDGENRYDSAKKTSKKSTKKQQLHQASKMIFMQLRHKILTRIQSKD